MSLHAVEMSFFLRDVRSLLMRPLPRIGHWLKWRGINKRVQDGLVRRFWGTLAVAGSVWDGQVRQNMEMSWGER